MMRKQKTTRNFLGLETLEDRCLLSSLPLATPLARPDAAAQAHASAAYGQLPLSFESNQGQTDTSINFLSRGSGYTLFLTPDEAVLSLKQADSENVVRMQLVGANSTAQVAGLDQQSGTSNYLVGNDPSQWRTDIANYGRVEYQNVYPGIDIVYYGNQRQLEYDFIVAPGADPASIRLAFQGAERLTLDVEGNLVLHTSGGDVVEHAPVVYQEVAGVRLAVAGRYVLQESGQVGFELGAYDVSQPLTIDPVLSYSTYLGGNTGDDGYGIAVDSAGNAYIIGDTSGSKFPTKNPLQPRLGSQQQYDAFVAKLNPTGTALVYSTYLGGNGFDRGEGIAVDGAGNAYVTGVTYSTNFPTKNAFQSANGGANGGGLGDAFIAKLNAAGSALLYSTYLGGNARDQGHAIAVDGSGIVYVTGETASGNFPTTLNALRTGKGSPVADSTPDAFVAKINPSGTGVASLAYATYLNGTNYASGLGIVADSLGNACVTGYTGSSDFPTTTGAVQTTFGGGNDAFVTKINAAGSALVYSTFLGGNGGYDRGYGIALDGSGNAYVTGRTNGNFPTTPGAYQTVYGGGYGDGFVTKIKSDGSALVYSTYLGGSGTENETSNPRAGGIAVDAFGNVFVTGNTSSTNLPTTVDAFQLTYGGNQYDAFVTKLNPTGSALVYSTYLGGNSMEQAFGIALDGSGNAYVTGSTSSLNFPTMNPFQAQYGGGGYDAFVTKISFGSALMAASIAPAMDKATATSLTAPQVQPLLDEAIRRWLGAGADVSILRAVNVQFADLSGTMLGLASGNTITLDNNAAGWGWFVDPTPRNDSEFTTRGNQGEQHRMDLLTVVMHELGHVLGHDHDRQGVMAETLSAGVRQTDPQRDHVALIDQIFEQSGDHCGEAWLGAAFAQNLESTRLGGKRRR